MFKELNFEKCEEGHKEKNKNFFSLLSNVEDVSYHRRSIGKDTYYDLLWAEDHCIPVPVFLQIIGEDPEIPRLRVIELLQENKNKLEVKFDEIEGAIPDENLDDPGKMRKWIEKDPHNFIFAPDEMKDDRELVLSVIQRNGSITEDGCTFIFCPWEFSELSDRLRDDYEVVLEAVRGDSSNFEYASERLRGDRRIALTAMRQIVGGYMMKFVTPELWGDKEVLFAALATCGQIYSLDFFPAELRSDPMIAIAAIKGATEEIQRRKVIEMIPAEIKERPEIVGIINSYKEMEKEEERIYLQFLQA